MITKVVVLGGGVAGMSAAHELIERDFEVAVYEKLRIPGGKARSVEVSQPIPPPWNYASAISENGKPLPGEPQAPQGGLQRPPGDDIQTRIQILPQSCCGTGKTVSDSAGEAAGEFRYDPDKVVMCITLVQKNG